MTENDDMRPVALITGASRGIGAAVARELARRGYRLVLAARSAPELYGLAAELSAQGCAVLPVPTDLCSAEQLARLVRLALGQFGRVDALVNNAGIGGGRHGVANLSEQELHAILMTNQVAPILLTRRLLPGMLERRRGAIIFIASVAGHIALPGSTLYSTTKFGLRGFAGGLRREVRRYGVGVTLVSPGFIATAMTAQLRLIPMPPPERVARAVAAAIERPRREVVVPGAYRLLIGLEQLLPGLGDLLLSWRRV